MSASRPIPKPAPPPQRPGSSSGSLRLEDSIRRAIRRDGFLNSEEAAVWTPNDAAMAPGPRATVPLFASLRQLLIPYQSMLDRAGWRVSFTVGEERARIEAFHDAGAVAMVTATTGTKTRVRRYVLPAHGTGKPRWLVVNRARLEHFAQHLTLPAGARFSHPSSKCRCPKLGKYPSEACARAELTNVQINKVVRRRGRATERRVYRCPDDDRMWHITSRARWYKTPPTRKA